MLNINDFVILKASIKHTGASAKTRSPAADKVGAALVLGQTQIIGIQSASKKSWIPI